MTSVRRVGAAYAKSMRTACTQASASVSNVALTRWRSANRPSQASSYTGDLAHVVRFSGGNAVHLSRWSRKPSGLSSCLTEPEPTRLRGSPKLDFISSEVRVRDNDIPMTHITVAVEGVQLLAYYSMLVIQSIFGNWDRALGSALLLSSCLSDIITEYYLANSFMSFSTSYLL